MQRGNKTKVFALSLLTLLIACGSGEKKKEAVKTVGEGSSDPGSVANAGDVQSPRYTINTTSWGAPADGKEHKAPEEPPIPVTWKEGQRQKFERDGLKRWKNTEIYVRRDR